MKREHRIVNTDAARRAVAFMRSLARRGGAPKGDKWSRESLYEHRMSRFDKEKHGLATVQAGWLTTILSLHLSKRSLAHAPNTGPKHSASRKSQSRGNSDLHLPRAAACAAALRF